MILILCFFYVTVELLKVDIYQLYTAIYWYIAVVYQFLP